MKVKIRGLEGVRYWCKCALQLGATGHGGGEAALSLCRLLLLPTPGTFRLDVVGEGARRNARMRA